ncbi:MAG TPA: FHA domain-containing protein [Polyangiaceae bacterium]|nr:FHA domain-containing protein [Polyangiaceae bacterium]HNZ23372.1 FHA domain-containing protein [Polyangiaceae bacterium]HOD22818.1 FHA domain-containing protein [Polyangiaceae bacterium]HOE50194.1 FHA domain-containing protein [Polyangiaceae bacterium]HOH03309.1 FHA domain-containing protein [Polyangiaceae bacterium]
MDDSRPTWPGVTRRSSSSSLRAKRSLSLFLEGEEFVLDDGEYLLGRSPSCDIVVDDMLVSRVHARISVTEGMVVLRDAGSTNGVYVNAARIDLPTPLRDGDRILVGTKELSVFAVRVGSSSRSSRPVVTNSSIPPPSHNPTFELTEDDDDRGFSPTEKTEAFTQLSILARSMMDIGETDGAIHLLSGYFDKMLHAAREGRTVSVGIVEAACRFAMEFAEAKHDPKWVDYVLEIHLNLRKPMTADLIDDLCKLRRKEIRYDPDLLLFYKAALQQTEPSLPLSLRVLCARIMTLDDEA